MSVTDWSAVMADTGTVAASSWVRPAGFGASLPSRATAYSAKVPVPIP
jgi:hypothetical protein